VLKISFKDVVLSFTLGLLLYSTLAVSLDALELILSKAISEALELTLTKEISFKFMGLLKEFIDEIKVLLRSS